MAFKNSYLAEIIKRLKKRRHKILYSHELKALIQKVMGPEYTSTRAYKLMYYLKNKGYVLSIKKDIFYIKEAEDHISEDLILEDRYRTILHKHCCKIAKKQRYIGGLKAIELSLNNLSLPEEILIVNPDKQAKDIVVSGKSIQFKKYSSKENNYFKQFKKHTDKMKMGKYSFSYAVIELALLEALYNFDEMYDRYTYEIIRKVVKKSKNLNTKIFEKILKTGKHHTSVNRLYKIAKKENKTLAEKLLPIIKKRSFVLDM